MDIKRNVFERDRYRCVCCGSHELESVPHHAYFGADADYGPTRNAVDQLVTICRNCHRKLHFEEGGSVLREFCKTYLKEKHGTSPETADAQ